MKYIEGFVAPVKTGDKEKYARQATDAARVFKDHGALGVTECWGDDVPQGKLTSIPMAVKLEKGETAVFSWITWPSKTVRDTGMEKAMQDPRMNREVNPMLFDGKRMIYGGFEVIVDE